MNEVFLRAHRFITGARIEPFGDQVSESQIGDSTLGLVVTDALTRAGFEAVMGKASRIEPQCLALPDTLFVNSRIIEEFTRSCPKTKGIFRLALRKGPLTKWLCPLADLDSDDDSVMFHCYMVRTQPPRFPSWEKLRDFLSESSQAVVLDPGSSVEHVPVAVPARNCSTPEILLPRTEIVAADISHWAHLVWINQLMPRLMLKEHGDKKKVDTSIIGEKCDIHPTALVQNSILGDGVKIGPFASVIDSVLGDGVELNENCRLKRCCVGHGCRTLPDSYFIGCTFYPGSTLANFMLRESIVGRQSFITSGLVFSTSQLDEAVCVQINGQRVNTGRWMLGSAVGHGCTLGTLGQRGFIAAGKEIPNGYMIVMNPADGLQRPPKNPRPVQAHMNVGGTAIPVAAANNGSIS